VACSFNSGSGPTSSVKSRLLCVLAATAATGAPTASPPPRQDASPFGVAAIVSPSLGIAVPLDEDVMLEVSEAIPRAPGADAAVDAAVVIAAPNVADVDTVVAAAAPNVTEVPLRARSSRRAM